MTESTNRYQRKQIQQTALKNMVTANKIIKEITKTRNQKQKKFDKLEKQIRNLDSQFTKQMARYFENMEVIKLK